ncbi:MAG: hypothetical protein K8T25_11820 [Planctomycetia bacterium]|nr:hypothetical protein [Planctomycetia bacterium]
MSTATVTSAAVDMGDALPGVIDPLAAAYIAAELAKLDEREAELLATAPAGDPETLGLSLRLMQARLRVMMYRERILSGASRRIPALRFERAEAVRVPGATPQPVAAEISVAIAQPPAVDADIPPRWVPGATPQRVAMAPVHPEPISVRPKPLIRPAEDAKPSTEATLKSGALPQAPVLSPQPAVQLPPAPVLPPRAATDLGDPLRPPPHLKGRKRNQWLKKMRHRPSSKPIDLDLPSADPKPLHPKPIASVSLPP